MDSDAADSHLPAANRGGGDAAPADSGADASVRLAGRTSSTQLDGSTTLVSACRRLLVRERVEDLGSAGGFTKWPHSFWAEPNNNKFFTSSLFLLLFPDPSPYWECGSWSRSRSKETEKKSCIQIRIDSITDPQHWYKQFYLLNHARFIRFQLNRNIFSFSRKKADCDRYKSWLLHFNMVSGTVRCGAAQYGTVQYYTGTILYRYITITLYVIWGR